MDFLVRFEQPIYAAMRIVVGFLFGCHGAQKLLGLFGGPPAEMGALLYVAGIIELVGGVLVVLGLFTRYAAFLCSGQMAVAYFMVHQPRGLLPIENGGELAALYAWIFLHISARGDGIWSLGGRSG